MIWRAQGGGLVLPDGRCDVFLTRVGGDWIPVVSGPGLAPFLARGTDWIGLRLPTDAGRFLPPEVRAGGVLRGPEAVAALPALAHMRSPDTLLQVVAQINDRPSRARWLRAALAALHSGDRPTTVARAAGIAPRTLRRIIGEVTGVNPGTLRALGRFHRALRLIRDDVQLVDVAATTGFADQAHLTRACRTWGGFTPGRMPDVALPGLPL